MLDFSSKLHSVNEIKNILKAARRPDCFGFREEAILPPGGVPLEFS